MRSGLCVMVAVCGVVCAGEVMAQGMKKVSDQKLQEKPVIVDKTPRDVEMMKPSTSGATPVQLRMDQTTPVTFEARVKSWPATQSFRVRWRLDLVCSPNNIKRLHYPSAQGAAYGGKDPQGVVFGATPLPDSALASLTREQTHKKIVVSLDGSSFPLACGNRITPYQLRVFYEVKGANDTAWTSRMWTVNHPGGLQ